MVKNFIIGLISQGGKQTQKIHQGPNMMQNPPKVLKIGQTWRNTVFMGKTTIYWMSKFFFKKSEFKNKFC